MSAVTNKLLMKEKEAAEFLGITVKTLQAWRYYRKNIPYHKIGNLVRYHRDDLIRYIEETLVIPSK